MRRRRQQPSESQRIVTIEHAFPRSLRARPTADEIAQRTAAEIGEEIRSISLAYQREITPISN